jgi:selenocysteine-specific elongation factor
VRSIHAQNQAAAEARAGQRCGINLTGPDLRRHEIHRGDWLVAPALATSATRLGVQLTLAGDESQALRDRTPVHVHLGAADLGGRITLLREGALAPGETAYATVTLDAPIVAVRGDRCVLRDQSATRTIGGGRVLEPLPYPRALTRTRRLPVLAALAQASAPEVLGGLLAHLPEGVDNAWFVRSLNLTETEAAHLREALDVAVVALPGGEQILLAAMRWQEISTTVQAAVTRHQAAEPAQTGLPETQLTKHLDAAIPARLARAASDALVRDGRLLRRAGHLCTPDHRAVLTGGDQALLARIEAELARHGLQAPALHDMLEPLKLKVEILRPFIERMAHLGRLHQISKYRFYLPAALYQLALKAEELAAESQEGLFKAADYRNFAGIGRNVTIEVLEYFDRIGLTQRYGQTRRLRRAVTEVLGTTA